MLHSLPEHAYPSLESPDRLTSSMVSLRAVSKDYIKGKITVPVLTALDMDIAAGECVALMGSSGSGKTTLLNLIGGMDRPSAGDIIVAGQALGKMSRARLSRWRSRNVGFVFQFYNLLPGLTAAQNIELPLMIRNVPRRRRAALVADALDVVGLADRRSHRPAELSGGQQQRVAIARALIGNPQILLCDEPTGDLDEENGVRILEILGLLNREHGKTIVVATHDPNVAARAGRTIRLDKRQRSEVA